MYIVYEANYQINDNINTNNQSFMSHVAVGRKIFMECAHKAISDLSTAIYMRQLQENMQISFKIYEKQISYNSNL